MTQHNPSEKIILIASSSRDALTCQPVVTELKKRGYTILQYEADKVASGKIPFEISIDTSKPLQVRYNNQTFDLANIAAAWYRRPSLLAKQKDVNREVCLIAECAAVQYSLWDMIPAKAWLNTPTAISHAEHKLSQLIVAKEVGLSIPRTVVTNSWKAIQSKLPEYVIFKASSTLFYSDNQMLSVFTKPFHNTPSELPMNAIPFPGFWQPYITKAKEWRITIVGEKVFSVIVYTDPNAKDDWRLHQEKPSVQFVRGEFPEAEKKKCVAFLRKLGLHYGAFDFIEDEQGKLTFLECNPNGQFCWLEEQLDLPISVTIAEHLATIANQM